MGLLVGDVVRRAAAAVPARPAVTHGGASLTFAELDSTGNQFGHAFAASGVERRTRVAWWADADIRAAAMFVGLARRGAVFAPISARISPTEAGEILGLAQPQLIVTDDARRADAATLAGTLTGTPTGTTTVTTLAELAEIAATAEPTDATDPALDERDPHVVFFTSGSTGLPKGVVLSHRANCLRGIPGLGDLPAGGTVCMFPLFHMASWTLALGAWQSRQAIHFVPADPDALLSAIEVHRATRIYLIPAVWSRVLATDLSSRQLASLREADTGTSATPPELLTAIRAALPWTSTRVFYGSTEAGPGTVLGCDDLARKPGSVGVAAPGVEVRIADNGEVEMRSEFLMDGYLDDQAATAAALVDGWYRTGDAGVLDADGYLSIVGRLRDVIRTGGETVAPAEVEVVLADHPSIADVAVVGLPDPDWGEVVCAVVVARDGHRIDVATIRAHCADRLATYKHPRRVELVGELPRTAATGQVQRTLLVERITALPKPL